MYKVVLAGLLHREGNLGGHRRETALAAVFEYF